MPTWAATSDALPVPAKPRPCSGAFCSGQPATPAVPAGVADGRVGTWAWCPADAGLGRRPGPPSCPAEAADRGPMRRRISVFRPPRTKSHRPEQARSGRHQVARSGPPRDRPSSPRRRPEHSPAGTGVDAPTDRRVHDDSGDPNRGGDRVRAPISSCIRRGPPSGEQSLPRHGRWRIPFRTTLLTPVGSLWLNAEIRP